MPTPGVVYTKYWVVSLILDMVGYDPAQNLTHGLVVEPSCGGGAFLRQIAERLCESARRFGVELSQLEGCVRAYDLDDGAVRKSRSVVREVLSRYGASEDVSARLARSWVTQADYLLAPGASAHWVVGNPPYVRSSLLPREKRSEYVRALSTMTMGTDLYVGFFEKALLSLDETGKLCFICSDRWLQNRYGTRLRDFVAHGYSLETHVRMHDVAAFEDAVSAYPGISLISKGAGKGLRFAECHPSFSSRDAGALFRWSRGDAMGSSLEESCQTFSRSLLPPLADKDPVVLAASSRAHQIEEMRRRLPSLEEAGVKLGIGIASGCDAVYVTDDNDLVEKDRLLPLFSMRDWRAGRKDCPKWLVDPWDESGMLVELDAYPRLRTYLLNHEETLRRRRVARDHPDQWYRTLDKPNRSLLGKEMLLFPDMSARPDPVYSDGSRYPHHNCYWLTSSKWDIKSLGGLLMSDVVADCIDAFGVKMRGSTLRFQAQYLRMLHIPESDDVSAEVKRELARAFERGDRALANAASRMAYGLEG